MYGNTALDGPSLHSKLRRALSIAVLRSELLGQRQHCDCLWLAVDYRWRFRVCKPLYEPGSGNCKIYFVECWQQLSPWLRSRHGSVSADELLWRNSAECHLNYSGVVKLNHQLPNSTMTKPVTVTVSLTYSKQGSRFPEEYSVTKKPDTIPNFPMETRMFGY
jgi:hypothetical protein